MNGYTDYTKGAKLPDFDLMKHLVETCGKPVIAGRRNLDAGAVKGGS